MVMCRWQLFHPTATEQDDEVMGSNELQMYGFPTDSQHIGTSPGFNLRAAQLSGPVAQASYLDAAWLSGPVAQASYLDAAWLSGPVAQASYLDAAWLSGPVAQASYLDAAWLSGPVARPLTWTRPGSLAP
ncbi:unnamed protein product [Boreogadus saida]